MSQSAKITPAFSSAAKRSQRQASGILARMSMAQKLGLVGALFLLPTLVQGVTLVNTQTRELSGMRDAQAALPYVEALDTLQSRLEQYTQAAASSKIGGKVEYQAAAQQVDTAVAQLAQLITANQTTLGKNLMRAAPLTDVKSDWETYKSSYSTMSVADLADGYQSLNQDYLQKLFQDVAHNGSLDIGAGDAALFYSQSIAMNALPALRASLNHLSLTTTGNFAALDDASRSAIRDEISQSRLYLSAINTQAGSAASSAKTAATSALQAQTSDFSLAIDAYLQRIEDKVNGQAVPNLAPLWQAASEQVGTQAQSALSTMQSLINANLSERLKTQRLSQLFSVLLLALAVGLLLLIIGNLLRSVRGLTDGARRLTKGDMNVHVPVQSRDEIGVVSASFNDAVTQLRQNALRVDQERLEAAKLQSNINEFLDVTMDIAEGDLTKRGKVTEDVLGNVVDSINLMTSELAGVLKGVQDASHSVTGGSKSMLGTTEQIQEGALLTSAETQRLLVQARQMNDNIQNMARAAEASADSARQALIAAEQGQEAVAVTLKGMQSIRESSQSVSERIASLGQRSSEIQEIVDSITHIASQTNLLSLHASVEAAGAGEAGRRFAVVADEVRQLADTSAASTQRVSTLIHNIQSEIRALGESIQQSAREVEQGYVVAGSAGESLRQIGTLAQQSAELAENISGEARLQVQGVEQMNRAVGQIATIAQESQSSVDKGRSAAEQLQRLAEQLNQSLSRFRLPS